MSPDRFGSVHRSGFIAGFYLGLGYPTDNGALSSLGCIDCGSTSVLGMFLSLFAVDENRTHGLNESPTGIFTKRKGR